MLYDYGIKKKLVHCNSLRKKGFESVEPINNRSSERGSVHDFKLEESLVRARSTIFELAYCNSWDYWVTLTIDPKRFDRTDLKGYQKALSQWLRDYKKKFGISVKYLFIPELHDDGNSWHMHGFIMGLPKEHLTINEHGYLDWNAYRSKFGYISMDPIRNREAVSKYATKYITKDMSKSVTELNANMYYCSQGLQRKILMKKGTLSNDNIPWDYENDYVHVKWLPTSVDTDAFLINPIIAHK